MKYKTGMIVEGKVTGIQPYGAFVNLDSQNAGLIHISEIRSGYIDNIHDILKIGDQVCTQVIDIDEYSGKASLSLRALEAGNRKHFRHHRFSNDRHKIGFTPLAKQLPIWIKESKEFLSDTSQGK